MRSLMLSLALLATACEHEPPPKKSPTVQTTPPPSANADTAPANTAPANTPPANTPPPPPGAPNAAAVDAGVPDAPPEPSQPCLDMATHLADVMLSEAKDPAQKAALEQDKTKIVRRAAEACTRDSWKPDVLQCFAKATTTDAMQICAKDLAGPTPQPGDKPQGAD